MKPAICMCIVVGLLFFCGCRVQREVIGNIQRQNTDSVVVVEMFRDTVVYTREDSSMLRALIECDSLGQAHLRELAEFRAGERLRPPHLSLKDNVLTATSHVDSIAIYLTLKSRSERQLSSRREYTTKPVITNVLTWWQTLWCTLGKLSVALAVLGLVVKFIKRLKF